MLTLRMQGQVPSDAESMHGGSCSDKGPLMCSPAFWRRKACVLVPEFLSASVYTSRASSALLFTSSRLGILHCMYLHTQGLGQIIPESPSRLTSLDAEDVESGDPAEESLTSVMLI
jgi:hypothetical protein